MSERDDAGISAHLASETRRLVGLLHALTGSRDTADELFQETCLEVWRSRERFDPLRDLGSWVRGIARMVALRHFRSAQRTRSVPFTDEVQELIVAEAATLPDAGAGADPRAPALRACLDELGPEHRSVLERFYADGWSHARIASGSGKSPDAVKMVIARLRQKLQSCIGARLSKERTHG